MFDHVSFGVRDLTRSGRFYDAVLAPLGFGREHEDDQHGLLAYGAGEPQFWLAKTASPVPDDPNSGLHVCFKASSRAAVDAFYKAALAAGGWDNGPPGLRPQYTPAYYAAFVRDPDGYRIEAVTYAAA